MHAWDISQKAGSTLPRLFPEATITALTHAPHGLSWSFLCETKENVVWPTFYPHLFICCLSHNQLTCPMNIRFPAWNTSIHIWNTSSPNAILAYVNQLAYIPIWPFSVNSRRHWLFLKAEGGLARWLVSLLMRSNQHESCRLTNNVTTVLTSFSHIRSPTWWQSDFDGIRKRANKQRLNRSIVWLADIFPLRA